MPRSAPLLLALFAGCTADHRAGPAGETAGAVPARRGAPNDTAGPPRFALGDGARTVVRLGRDASGGETRTPVLRVGDLPREWEPMPGVRFGVAADSFDFAVPSADGRFVAWQGGGVHTLLGVVRGDGGPPRVLDFFFDSQAADVQWARGGPYLVARYTGPSGYAEAPAYDAARGVRLRAPWREGCPLREACEVVGVRWTGPTTLAVTVRGPGRGPREYAADLARLAPEEGRGPPRR